jgi:hypothetical protein
MATTNLKNLGVNFNLVALNELNLMVRMKSNMVAAKLKNEPKGHWV